MRYIFEEDKTFSFAEFAASEPVVGLPEGTLLQYFSQLRQLLDLFMSWDWPTYFHDYGHDSSKYNLVTPNMAVLLLEKYVQPLFVRAINLAMYIIFICF